ncbi:hypothetical protein [Paenibacillus sp. S150]|uniref:hypothetical protein n=1 Tax=Paenibacillus sp. S150 TaxID=2749826 RepID=UPI001C566B5A|nr:hypothetical protein [Paenibacillus sp. S150]MBW4083516.1 hypothetical protein [Paenibacillus sp. S150]
MKIHKDGTLEGTPEELATYMRIKETTSSGGTFTRNYDPHGYQKFATQAQYDANAKTTTV